MFVKAMWPTTRICYAYIAISSCLRKSIDLSLRLPSDIRQDSHWHGCNTYILSANVCMGTRNQDISCLPQTQLQIYPSVILIWNPLSMPVIRIQPAVHLQQTPQTLQLTSGHPNPIQLGTLIRPTWDVCLARSPSRVAQVQATKLVHYTWCYKH